MQAVPQPRIACAEQLLELCDEHCHLEHQRTLSAGVLPACALIPRLLGLLPKHLHACTLLQLIGRGLDLGISVTCIRISHIVAISTCLG